MTLKRYRDEDNEDKVDGDDLQRHLNRALRNKTNGHVKTDNVAKKNVNTIGVCFDIFSNDISKDDEADVGKNDKGTESADEVTVEP